MTIDSDKLLSFAIPEGRQQVSARDHAFYALSIGLGQDPLDERQLRFVTDDHGIVPVPSVVLVLAHPGFYLGDPRSGVDPTGVIHLDQSFEVSGTIPVHGCVESRTRVVDLIDKGAGKAAIIVAETTLDYEGRPFAHLRRSTMVRGGGGFGGKADAPSSIAPEGDGPPVRTLLCATRPEQALYYRLNGDLNPLHSDPARALAAGFDRPILHGLCTAGIICTALLNANDYDENKLRRMTTRFTKPVFPGESLIVDLWANGCFRATVKERAVVAASGTAA